MQINHSHLAIDTCCLLNLCASGELLNILKVISISAQATIVEEVKQELQEIDHLEQFESAITKGLLLIVDFQSEAEETAFINYAFDLDDGESATGAIAIQRNWAIATDDKKAIKFFSQESPSLQIISTPEIMKYWSEKANIEQLELSNVLQNIRLNGRYTPPKNHPLKSWWERIINSNQRSQE
jgi:predicted nucleic acid-binding protein